MSLITSEKMLLDAQRGGYAVGAFNVENMEMVQAVITAAEELRSPVILQTTPSTTAYAPPALFAAMAAAVAQEATVPVAMHLDHGNSFALCAQALRAGYTSIMIDGSKLPLAENIALTAHVVEMCKASGVPVEGELGQVGGKEDDTVCENAGYTIPSEAVQFEAETGVSSMAVGIGTAHGIYATAPVLNVELVETLSKLISVPLVMHGASGLSDESIQACIAKGICKVNFATELRIAFSDAVKETISRAPDVFDPKKYGKCARAAVSERVKNRMMVCGCEGKA